MLLKGKTAIVTGGSHGIGETIVKKLCSHGCKVVFTFRTSKGSAERIIKQTKNRAIAYKVDIRSFEQAKDFISKVKIKYKKIDILINNAGISKDKSLMLMTKQDWQDVIDTNLTGVFNVTKAAIVTFLKQKSGSIVNIASLSGLLGVVGQTNYSASKAGVVGFTKALAKEAGPYNVRVNAVAPGFIKTSMVKKLSRKYNVTENIPLRRLGETEEVADLVLFLCSKQSAYITGQTIIIDGGLG